MKRLLLPFFIFSFLLGHANDGVFYAQGNTLVPIQETTVELRKEVLRLTRLGDEMVVEVNFTFFNPGPAKKVIVGFVTPPAVGDISEEEAEHPFIDGFTVNVNGESLPFQVATMEETGFKVNAAKAEGWDFVYYFDVDFEEGVNHILHTYRFRGGSSVECIREFSYRLTTGKMWANKEIEDFTLEIDMGEDAFYSIPSSFYKDERDMGWITEGESRIGESKSGLHEGTLRMVSQHGGKISLKAKHFKPDYDIWINQFQIFNEVAYWANETGDNPYLNLEVMFLIPGFGDVEELKTLDKNELGLIRNYYFARQGYVFQSEKYQQIFSKMMWYYPRPNKEIALTEKEEEYVKLIRAVELEK